jgi:hypothetical protein
MKKKEGLPKSNDNIPMPPVAPSKKESKIGNGLARGFEWFNGFAFRFFLFLFGSIVIVIGGTITIIVATIVSILWIFVGKDTNMAEFKAYTESRKAGDK